jgi:hypothetical protein
MTDQTERPYAAFRLNLEQQKKRAKERAKATGVQLAKAQFDIATELGFASWAKLKLHIAAMDRERAAMEVQGAGDAQPPLDAGMRTLHLRCGSDIHKPLIEAGFKGDFLEHSYPYAQGPVREGPGALEQRARFIVDGFGNFMQLDYESQLAGAYNAERQLLDSANYERVVIWSEHDPWDQLALLRFLDQYSRNARPRVLELINVQRFPGSMRFIGLGQLPPEALRLLWTQRHPTTPAQLALGAKAWAALASDDPRPLAAIASKPTPLLPLLGPALHRHLCQLPSVQNGLSLTEHLILQLASEATRSMKQILFLLNNERDPIPSNTDLLVRSIVINMRQESRCLLKRTQVSEVPGWNDTLEITGLGRQVLAGEVDWLSLGPPPRWVGGVEIGPGLRDWRWDEARREAAAL